MTLIGILAILLMVGTISSQSYVKKASAQTNKEVEQARTAPTNNTLSWFDKELEKPTAAETEKHKSTATEKPEKSVLFDVNKEFEHAKVEGTIKQGGKVNNEINKIQCHQGVRREPGMSLYEEGLRTKERHAACTRYIEEVLGRGGNTPTKVEDQRIE